MNKAAKWIVVTLLVILAVAWLIVSWQARVS